MLWSVENPQHSRQETEALETLASRVDWLIPGEWRIDSSLRLIWDADILVGERRFPVSLRYPTHFPHSPPLVLPRDVSERWSLHQYGPGGELCLEYGPDNWHPDITGADMIESAYRLLAGEHPAPQETGQVASRHATTLGQNLRGDRMRFLITRELAAIIDGISDGEAREGEATGTFRDGSVVYVIGSLSLNDGQVWKDEGIPKTIFDEGLQRPIAVFRLPAGTKLPSMKSRSDFIADAAAAGVALPKADYALVATGESLHAYLLWESDDSACPISIIPAQPPAVRLDESHVALKPRKVAVVGCGSLGSKLAAMLARSGVGNFLLVDDDVMLPDNIIRNDLDWREMGCHKADGVARRIGLVNPEAKCEVRQSRLGGQQSSGSFEGLIETLSGYDLIVDASADARVFNYLCAAVEIGKKPMLWAEVFGGGFGGMIARYRPGLEPKPAAMRAAIEQWCVDQGKPIERARAGYEGGSATPLIADDADVTVIAAHAARLAIDTLIPREPSIFPNSVYMIGLAAGWVFEQPFDTRPIDVGPPPPEEAQPPDPALVVEETARLLQLLKKFSDASPAAPADPSAA